MTNKNAVGGAQPSVAQEQCVHFDLRLGTGYGRGNFTRSPDENFYVTKNIDIESTPLKPSLCISSTLVGNDLRGFFQEDTLNWLKRSSKTDRIHWN